MAIVILRFRASEKARRKGYTFNKEAMGERRENIDKLLDQLGLVRLRSGRSLNGHIVMILDGTAEKTLMLQQVMDQSGAYDHIEAEVIETIDSMLERSEDVQRLVAEFQPPDQDEIDRILLEE